VALVRYGRHPLYDRLRPLRLGKEKKERRQIEETTLPQGKNIMPCPIPYGGHKKLVKFGCVVLRRSGNGSGLFLQLRDPVDQHTGSTHAKGPLTTNLVVLAMFSAGAVFCHCVFSVLPEFTTRTTEIASYLHHAVRT